MENEVTIMTKGNYTLIVDKSSDNDGLSYQVRNNLYKVIEAETRILPQAYKFLEDLSAALDVQLELELEDAVQHAGVNVTSINKKV